MINNRRQIKSVNKVTLGARETSDNDFLWKSQRKIGREKTKVTNSVLKVYNTIEINRIGL